MIPTFAQLDAAIADGHVKRTDQGPLSIYNYTTRCTFDSAWDDVTVACRGLVLNRDTGEVVALPWPKFFNHGQPEAGDVPEGNPVVTVKLDGSLGICYRYEGRLRWTTRGTFFSPQAAVAQRIWDARYSHITIPDDWTVMVEIISPDTRVVVRYDYEDLVVLGVRMRSTGHDLSQDITEAWARTSGFRIAERVPLDLGSAISAAAGLDEQHEGFVLRWGSYRRKVKGSTYIWIARLLKLRELEDQQAYHRLIADWWYDGDAPNLLAVAPEKCRADVARVYAEMDAAKERLGAKIEMEWWGVEKMTDRKAVALHLKTRDLGPLFGPVIKTWAGQLPDVGLLAYRERFAGQRPRSGGA